MYDPITILIYYLFVYIVSSINNYKQYIHDGENFMDTLFYDLKNCEYDYDIEDIEYYKYCLSNSLFGRDDVLNNIPDSYNIYIDNFYKASSLSDDEDIYGIELKKVYFDFILSILKLSANDEKYNNLYKIIMSSLLIKKTAVYDDIKNGKIDISKIDDIDYVSIAQELFYKDLFIDFSKKFEEKNYSGKDFFKLNSKNYNENLFLKVINEKFFNNEYSIDQVGFLIKNSDSYNMQGLYLVDNDNNNIDKNKRRYDTIFKENTYRYLIDFETNYQLYLPKFKEYLKELCDLYHSNNDHMKALSAMDLEDYFNINVIESNESIYISRYCNSDYDTVHTNWKKSIKSNLNSIVDEIDIFEYADDIVENILIENLISEDLNKRSTENDINILKKREDNNFQSNILSMETKNYIYSIFLKNNKSKEIIQMMKRDDKPRCTDIESCKKFLKEKIIEEVKGEKYKEMIRYMNIDNIPTKIDLQNYFNTISGEVSTRVNIPEEIKNIVKIGGEKVLQLGEIYMKEKFLDDGRHLHLMDDGEKYVEVHRNKELYDAFHMQSCRNPEVQFLSLAKEYNRIIGQGSNSDPNLKISITGEVYDGEEGFTTELKYKIIEKPEELEQDYKMNNKLNDNTEPNTNENTEEDQNILDKLSRDQRNSIRNILYESPIYLRNIKYSYEDRYDSLNGDGEYMRSYVLNKIEPIVENCNNILENKNLDGYIIAPKTYINKNSNTERIIDNEKEKIYYIDDTNKNMVEAQKEEMIFIKDGKKLNEKDNYLIKNEYILPKKIKSAYVISNEEIKEENLEAGENVFVIYDDSELEVKKVLKKGVLDIDTNKSYKLHKCDEVDVNFAKIKNNNFEKNSNNERTKNEYLEINENGKIYFNTDESIISFTFGEYDKNINIHKVRVNELNQNQGSKSLDSQKSFSVINIEKEANTRKKNLFFKYVYLEHGFNLKYVKDEINKELLIFREKLLLSLKRETIFAKDINEILASYEYPNSSYRRRKVYIKMLKEIIDDILYNPIEIESGYIQMITQIYNNHFNVEGNKNKQKIKSIKETNDKFKLFDKRCRLIIEDILKETPLNLKDVKYFNELEFDGLSTEIERLNEIAIKIIDLTINKCMKSLDNGECYYTNMILNKSVFETIEKNGNNEENITDNKDKVGNIKYSYEDRYDSLNEDGEYLQSYVLKKIEPIVKNCNNILENKNLDGYIIAPKTYINKNSNKERIIDNEKEKIYYIDDTNNNMVEAQKEEMIFIKDGKKLNEKDNYLIKNEYILPKKIKSAYVISNEEIKEENLEAGENVFVIYDDSELEVKKVLKKEY
ncbi:hypothetical protein PIROE2DRAFT_64123 [Piromyces sp. E2]|nr:hypothetical protein PIROE2DRAFT_64123 [Piromyces sp. E2]|eukprot:OUM58889.1 hypothetical protein PIROE2DRAFT_64123 [Piromyces sp. E2]